MKNQQGRIRCSLPATLLLLLLLSVILSAVTANLSNTARFFGTRRRIESSLSPSIIDRNQHQRHDLTTHNPLDESSVKISCIDSLHVRGGFLSDDEEAEEEDLTEEAESDDDENLFGLDEDDFESAEDEFAEENHLERTLAAWKKTPPLTKSYLSASFAATAWGYIFNKNEFPSLLLLEWQPILKRLQIWRPLTAFLNFGPLGLGYVMTFHFVWTYMSTLERLHHSRPYDFWIMILFGQLCMVIGYPIFKMSPKFLGHNLSTFLVYIWSRFHEGMEVNMFELFNSRAELLPWFFLAQVCRLDFLFM